LISHSHKATKTPVYYIQYAHARICSVQRKARENDSNWQPSDGLQHLGQLQEPEALALSLTLGRFPEVVAGAAERLEPHDIANYLRTVAGEFHSFYNAHKLLDAESETSLARLALAKLPGKCWPMALICLVSAPPRACDDNTQQNRHPRGQQTTHTEAGGASSCPGETKPAPPRSVQRMYTALLSAWWLAR
jgi:hypothetical protein